MELFKLLGTIAIENSDAIDAIEDTTEKAEHSSSKMVNAFKKIGSAVATFLAVDKIKDFGLACVNAAADANAMNSQFSQVFGDLEADASGSLSTIAKQAGITENRMKGSFTKIAAFAKTTGMATEDALSLADRAMIAVADSAAFYDRSLEDTTESLQSFLKGNFENDSALGLSCTETTRNAAANELYGKSFIELSEAQKQLTLLQMVEDANAASGALGQAARESETWTNQTGNLKQAWTDFEAIIGATFLPTMINLVSGLADKIQVASEKVAAFSQWCSEHETILSILGVAVGTITTAIVAYNVAINAATIATTISTAATTAFGAVMAFVTSPITAVIGIIGALIAIGVALYQNWDVITAKCAELWQNVKDKFTAIKTSISEAVTGAKDKAIETFQKMKNGAVESFNNIKTSAANTFNSMKATIKTKVLAAKDTVFSVFRDIKDGIKSRIESARDTVRGAIDKIKGFFNFQWNLPHLKMPHPYISGSFSLNPPSVPSFGISWYKKAMNDPIIMNSPTAFGINKLGQIMAGGEAGSEVVSGTDTLMNMISEAVAAKNARLEGILANILAFLMEYMPQMANMQLVTDTGALIGELAPGMDEALGELARREERGI